MKLQKNTLNDQLLMQQDETQDTNEYNWRQKQQFEFNSNSINPHQPHHNITHKYNNNNSPIVINYQHVIDMQSSMIEALYKQCTFLRQHVRKLQQKQKLLQTITVGCNTKNCKHQAQNHSPKVNNADNKNDKQSNNNHHIGKPSWQQQQSINQMTKIIQTSILKQISTVLNIPQHQSSRAKVIQAIKRLQWERQKRLEPIFIQSKKEVRIPVPVEVIVEKPVEKIVYRERIVVQEVPVFREKIVEKLGLVIEDNSNSYYNSNNCNNPKGNTTSNFNPARSPKNYYNNNSNKPYVSPKQSYHEKNVNYNSNYSQSEQRFYKSNKFNHNNNNINNKYEEHRYCQYQNQQTSKLSKHPSTKALLKNPSNKALYYENKQPNSKRHHYHDDDHDDRRR